MHFFTLSPDNDLKTEGDLTPISAVVSALSDHFIAAVCCEISSVSHPKSLADSSFSGGLAAKSLFGLVFKWNQRIHLCKSFIGSDGALAGRGGTNGRKWCHLFLQVTP